jgi:glucose-1-phosphate adenylyltransferase
MKSVLAVVLGGGAGTRLHPLTQERSKPAVPFGGKYRIVDVPLSNCLNSGINRIYILTQYNSASLNQHVGSTFRFSQFSRGFCHVLAAEQTPGNELWFQGTADAVRKSIHHLRTHSFERILILSADQLYQMDLQELLAFHVGRGAGVTVATTPVVAEDAPGFGIMQTAEDGRIARFVEKPPADRLEGLDSPVSDAMRAAGRVYLASMGIYVFERDLLFGLLQENQGLTDFGRDVIPHLLERRPVHAFPFAGYWTDIGTIASFYEANLALTRRNPPLELHDAENPIYTHARNLPPSEFRDARLHDCIVAPGVNLEGCTVRGSVIGVRAIVRAGTDVEASVLMGADVLQGPADAAADIAASRIPAGIGEGCIVRRAIIDKNARIGRRVRIVGSPERTDEEGPFHVVRDGIVVIKKGAIIPDDTVI